MEERDYLSQTPQYVQPNLPNATPVLVLGIISIVGSFCYGIVGLICGIIALILANKDRKLYLQAPDSYSPSSYGTLNAGRTCSIIGIILSSLVIIAGIFYIMLFLNLATSHRFQ